MDIAGSVITFVIIWWLVLFMVLPFGVRQPDNPDPVHAVGAPERPMLLVKFGVTTIIAGVLLAIAWVIADLELINFRNMG
ncbi:MAG: putative secreted protein [Alphaproteobacteria bacterium]|jgi:predicted secreted protein